ncbi:MAG: ABC transporter permease [Caldilineaceae bacterium]
MFRPRVFLDYCRLTLQRLASRPILTLLTLVGIVLAVGLLTSAGFFSQAVDRVILLQELDDLSQSTGRIPFSTRVYVQPSARRPLSLQDAENVGRSVAGTLSGEIKLPLKHLGIQVESGGLMLLPAAGDTRYGSPDKLLSTVNLVYIDAVAEHMEIVAGEPLGVYDPVAPETLDVWMHARMAEEMGVRAGEKFQVTVNLRTAPRQVYIRGIWQAKDPTDSFWFSNPDTTLRSELMVTRQGYVQFAEPMLASKTGFVGWHIILDDRAMNPAYAARYANGFEHGMTVINQYLPGSRLDVSPLGPLKDFVLRQSTLTLVLLGFNIPALAFLFYFLGLISLIVVRWQQRETALLVSRGMNVSNVLGLVLIEQLLLFVLGLPLGIGLGMALARGMGYTASFLDFTYRDPLPVSLQGINFILIGIALAFALLSRLAPVVGAARQSVVVQAREGARPLRPPFWQRIYLDFVLILPTWYVYRQLLLRGTLATSPSEGAEQFLNDPLLVLAPALFILTTCLLIMRVFPWLLMLLDFVASRTPWLTLHLAFRQLGRSTQSYINPLLLVIVALAMGVYTRSMAQSLDQWLVDRVYYHIGADVSFVPAVISDDGVAAPTGVAIPPKDDFLTLPGAVAATRVGDYQIRIGGSGKREDRGRMLVLERLDFGSVAWFRRDFADEPLGSLMNRLALSPENVLVTEQFLAERQLRIGDKFSMSVRLDDGVSVSDYFTIAGIYRHFPTVEADELVVIGNLDNLFTLAGAEFEHQIWIRMADGAPGAALFKAVESRGMEATHMRDAHATIAEEQARMERVGIFGTLSVGFLAATVMAMLALLVHNYASLQERHYQFGVMRAIGLLHGQVLSQVALEYIILSAYGAFVGASIGLTTAELFTPFFRIPDKAGAPMPPLLPLIDQNAALWLALLFVSLMVIAELSVLARVLNMRLFSALRMGHQG